MTETTILSDPQQPEGAEIETTMVTAEDAPLGVLLWPTIGNRWDPNFTLMAVEIVTTKTRYANTTHETTKVVWVYESGKERTFDLGEKVACKIVASAGA